MEVNAKLSCSRIISRVNLSLSSIRRTIIKKHHLVRSGGVTFQWLQPPKWMYSNVCPFLSTVSKEKVYLIYFLYHRNKLFREIFMCFRCIHVNITFPSTTHIQTNSLNIHPEIAVSKPTTTSVIPKCLQKSNWSCLSNGA